MAVRWQISFKTLSDRDGLVKIYDSTYSGDAIELTPATQPFSVTQRQSELITPVVSDSGYLRIIDNGIASEYIDDLHPESAMDRKIEFYVDSVLTWRGYISPESFSMPWESAPREMALPLVGVLDALAGVNITDTGKANQPIASFLYEILIATGFSFTGVLFPRQMLQYFNFSDAPEFRLQLSRYNFLKLNDADYEPDTDWSEFVGDSWLKVLEEICRYFGWTASAQGSVLVLSTPRTDITDYALVNVSDLPNIEHRPTQRVDTTAYTRSTVSSLDFDGVSHRRSISNGKKRITITAESPAPDGIYPEILFNGDVEYSGDYDYSFEVHPTGVDHKGKITGRNKVLNIDREHVTLHKYVITDIGTSSESYHEVDWEYPENADDMVGPGAYLVKSFSDGYVKKDNDVVDGSDVDTTKETYINALRLTGNKGLNSGSSTVKHFTEIVPLASIKSRSKCRFPNGGCICISADVQNSFARRLTNVSGWVIDPSGMSMWGSFRNYLKCSLRIGNKYYDGSMWVSTNTPLVFDVSCLVQGESQLSGMEQNGVGLIANRLDIKIPDPGTQGYIVPVDYGLEGEMELTFYNWAYTLPANGSVTGNSFVSLYISNLSFSWYKGSDDEEKDLRLSRLTGKRFQDDLSISLKLSSINNNRLSQATLWFNEFYPVGRDYNITYPGSLSLLRPEEWLMYTMLMLYSKPSEQLTLEVSLDSTLKVYDLVSIGGKNYIITGRETDYADEHVKLYIVSYE